MAVLLLPVGELDWELLLGSPGQHHTFPKQDRGGVCAGDRQAMDNTAYPGYAEG